MVIALFWMMVTGWVFIALTAVISGCLSPYAGVSVHIDVNRWDSAFFCLGVYNRRYVVSMEEEAMEVYELTIGLLFVSLVVTFYVPAA